MSLYISVIIPTLNEASCLEACIKTITERADGPDDLEVIISDGKSQDKTAEIAENLGIKVVRNDESRRSVQLNAGAASARGNLLYFLHADTIPPTSFDTFLRESVNSGVDSGCFRMRFDSHHPVMRFYGWFTRFNLNILRGGDQSLFCTREIFEKLGGYKEDMILMEDYDIVRRLQKESNFVILPQIVTTSPRKYRVNGIIRLQWIFACIQFMYRTGAKQGDLVSFYQKHVRKA